jgi:hypothetical protein
MSRERGVPAAADRAAALKPAAGCDAGSRSRRRTRAGQQLHSPKFFSISTDPLLEARREARGEAILVVVTMALLIVCWR